jgi:hypothetical protein
MLFSLLPKDETSESLLPIAGGPYCFIKLFEIDLGSPLPIYQFKVRKISGNRGCVLVKEESSILKKLKTGQKLKMKYWLGENLGATKIWNVQIMHITKQIHGSLKGHFVVGFSILNTF